MLIPHGGRVPELLRRCDMDYGQYGHQAGDDELRGTIRADGITRDATLIERTLRGGTVVTELAVRARDEVRLMFAVPGDEPLIIDCGVVRYVEADRIGVEFVHMSEADRARYRSLLLNEFKRLH